MKRQSPVAAPCKLCGSAAKSLDCGEGYPPRMVTGCPNGDCVVPNDHIPLWKWRNSMGPDIQEHRINGILQHGWPKLDLSPAEPQV